MPDEHVLRLLKRFTQSLAHDLKTPLSVISNDLFYLQTLLSPHECARSLERSKEISGALDQISSFSDEEASFENISLNEVFEESGFLIEPKSEDLVIRAEQKSLNFALSLIGKISGGDPKCALVRREGAAFAIINRTENSSLQTEEFKFFSELQPPPSIKATYLLPLLDVVILSHQGKTKIRSGSIIGVELSFPEVPDVPSRSTTR